MSPTHRIEITREALRHIRSLDRKYHGQIFRALRTQLSTEPFRVSRNRKPLYLPSPFGAHWELRFGPQNRFRAFYAAEQGCVLMVAVGVKQGERLFIAGEEV